MPRGQMSPEKRAVVTAAGGRKRAATMTAEERRKVSAAGAAAVNSAPGLARRLLAKWPQATEAERAEVLAILAELG